MVIHTRDSCVITFKNITFENETSYEERGFGGNFDGNLLV
jgi:hypothetical protein